MCIPAVRRRVKNNNLPRFSGRKERGRGRWWWWDFFTPFFSYNFKYFGGRLDLRSDLADRYALKIDFPKVSQGSCTRTDAQRGRLTFKMIELEVSDICCVTQQQTEHDSRCCWFILSYMCPLLKCFFFFSSGNIVPDQTQQK